MKLSLNGATTMKADLATDIRVASEAGFDCLEIWAAKLRDYLASHTAAELRSLFDEQRIEPYSINSIEQITFRDGEGKEMVEAECEELCGIASNIGCPYVVAVPGLLPEGATRSDVIEESVTWLSRLGSRAQCHNVGIAFEFLGQPGCSVQTLELADEIVRQVARHNVGLVIDSFHFYAGGSTIKSIAALDAERLFIFHINDAEDRPREQLEDRHRLLPGLGILPLGEMVAALHRIGYDGVASVEIFRPEYWDRDPQELARASRRAAASVLGMG